MKKILFIFLSFFLLVSSIHALDFDIESVSIKDKSDTIEVSEPVLEDSTINSNITFNEVGDYVTYEITLKNNTGEELIIDSINDNNENEFVVTTYNKDGLKIFATLEYKKELTGNLDLNNIEIEVILDNGEEVIINPKTFDNNMNLYMFLILFSLIAVAIIIKLKEKSIGALIVIIMIVPVMLMASSSFKINITFKSENIVIANNDVVPDEPTVTPITYPLEYVSRKSGDSISIGDEIAIGSEHFYVVSTSIEKTVLIAKYNLYVGLIYNYNQNGNPRATLEKKLSSEDEGYGLQSSLARGWVDYENGQTTARYVGVVPFSGSNYWDGKTCSFESYPLNCTGTSGLLSEYSVSGETTYTNHPYVYNKNLKTSDFDLNNKGYPFNNSYTIAYYVENYVNKLKEMGMPSTITGRLLRYEETKELGCSPNEGTCLSEWEDGEPTDANAPSWVYSSSYWLGNANSDQVLNTMSSNGEYSISYCAATYNEGVRPVIEIYNSDIFELTVGNEQIDYTSFKFINRQDSSEISEGDEVALGREHFYVVYNYGDKTVLFAKHNLLVGDIYKFKLGNPTTIDYVRTLGENDYRFGFQSNIAKGEIPSNSGETVYYIGSVPFSGKKYWSNSPDYVYDSSLYDITPNINYETHRANDNGYTIAYYVERYVNKLKSLGAPSSITGRLMYQQELEYLGCIAADNMCSHYYYDDETEATAPEWVYSSSYWTGSSIYNTFIYNVDSEGYFGMQAYNFSHQYGVRPVIEVNSSDLN